ncbi:aspartic peptidase domain-containing protein [Lasiosphaeria hispida]|uniref:Probable aspartic-type endopeptidase OPSB n=1 Tax=Lasiosphaeria hispida TaxID=260671 RepID=A0AAJ0MGD6_9PEZI|nr:aspartic peptidase domain-containing protein [Lasiosphaeria hispida]
MKTTSALAIVASILSTTEALAVKPRQDGPRVVGLQTERRRVSNPLLSDRIRRRGSITATLDNEETLYFINVTVGTPPSTMRLHIDTGSSDLWVNTPGSQLCEQRSLPCQFGGTYAANRSSTYEYVSSVFNISYVDGSGASGDYVSDTVTVGGQKLDRLQFGIGYSSTNPQGILGIGYTINEVQVNRAGRAPYNNMPAQMVANGLIQSNAYSLWLNDLDANTGSILFGGIDEDRFTGPLQTLPIQSEQGAFAEFLITLTGVSVGGTTVADRSNTALAVLLDSGSSLTYLPDTMVQSIYNELGVQYDADNGVGYVPCSLAQNTTTFRFTFSEPAIEIDMNEMVLDLITSSGRRATFQNGVTACMFGIAPVGQGTSVLGDTFLRSAYVVYDLANNEISLAQTRFNATTSNVKEISTGANSVPGATRVTGAVAATQGISGPSIVGGIGANSAAGRGMVVPGVVAAGAAVVMAAFMGL